MRKIIIAFLISTSCYYGAFYDLGAGARATGLGGSFTGVADDVNAMYYNIAGIGQLKEIGFTGTYSSYFASFYSGYTALVLPIYKKGAIGVEWSNTVVPYYSENIITLGYSLPLSKTSFLGVGGRLFMKSYSASEWTVLNSDYTAMSATGIGVCLSGLTKIGTDMTLGFSLENINQPDVSIKYKDPVDSVYRIGASYKLMKGLIVSAQGDARGGEIKAGIGSEYWMDSKFLESFGIRDTSLGIRAGYVQGTSSVSNLTAGFSVLLPIKMMDLRLDYSLTFPFGFIDGANTHRITINISEPKPLFNM